MNDFGLTHLSDDQLLRDLATMIHEDRRTTVRLLAHIAEVDFRRLYAGAGYASMFLYCVEGLGLSEGAAYRRIRAARAGREYPQLLLALVEGRLHLAAVSLLAPHAKRENVDELIGMAAGKKKADLEFALAERFPVGGIPTRAVQAVVQALPRLIPGRVELPVRDGQIAFMPAAQDTGSRLTDGNRSAQGQSEPESRLSSVGQEQVTEPKGGPTGTQPSFFGTGPYPAAPADVRFLVRFTIDRDTHGMLRRAQELLSHSVPDGNLAVVMRRALSALIAQLEKEKLGTAGTSLRPRRPGRRGGLPGGHSSGVSSLKDGSSGKGNAPRTVRRAHIPRSVRRTVWERDRGQCTFRSAAGQRCQSRSFLEFDHVVPVARGGGPSVENLRLRCRTHNQLEADRAFGANFMRKRRADRATDETSSATPKGHKLEPTEQLILG